MVLHLPRWATDYLKQRDRSLAGLKAPLVLYERQKGAMRLVALDEKSSNAGLYPGQSLADARAIAPGLEAREIDRALLANAFADFADWHSHASPIVAVLADMTPFGDLVIDITGVSHLFGGEENMLALLTSKLRGLGFSAQGAVAQSVGAAWALAHFAPGQVAGTDLDKALAGLPVRALRLDESQAAGLEQMGLKRIGQLYGRERKPLQARFGASLLTRLDQALGLIEERVTPRLPVAERYAERRFADPIGLIDDVLMSARDLAIQLCLRLAAEGLGAQGFHLLLYRVDHKVMRFSVNAARATRDPDHVARLFSNRAEQLTGEFDAGFGIDAIRLAASSVTPLGTTQIGAFETRDGAEDLDRLYDRITSRLGPLAVTRSRFVNSHIPERAVRLEPVMARQPDDPAARPDPHLQRPLRLLPAPEAISVVAEIPDGPPARMVWRRVSYRFVKTSGPERIGVEWWHLGESLKPTRIRQGDEPPKLAEGGKWFAEGEATRDYYIAEDDAGRRFWVFRQGLYGTAANPLWFVHGLFS
jgi:protein ImuB